MKTLKIMLISILFIMLMTINLYSLTATKKCSTKTESASGSTGAVTTCTTISDNNNDGVYDHLVVWQHVKLVCGGIITKEWEGNIHEHDFKFRDPSTNTGYFNDIAELDPDFDDCISEVIYQPSLFEVPNPEEWEPVNFRIIYKDATNNDVIGELEKTTGDSIALYTSYKVGTNFKFTEDDAEFLKNFVKYSDENFRAVNINPNPVKDFIKFSLNFNDFRNSGSSMFGSKVNSFKIYDINSKEYYSREDFSIFDVWSIDASRFPNGSYVIELITESNNKFTTSFVVAR